MNFVKWIFILLFSFLTIFSFAVNIGNLNVANGKFVVDSNGDITKINNVAVNFPSSLQTGLTTVSLGTQGKIVKVAKDGTGDFTTITSAIAAISGETSTNPYTILVYPGVYNEQALLRDYISLVGIDRKSCKITSTTAGSGSDSTKWTVACGIGEVRNLTIENLYTSYASTAVGIRSNKAGRITDCDIYSAHADTVVLQCGIIENCDVVGGGDTISITGYENSTCPPIVKNCKFTCTANAPLLWVGNGNGTWNTYIYDSVFIGSTTTGHIALVDNVGSGTVWHNIYLYGCKFLTSTGATSSLLCKNDFSPKGAKTTIFYSDSVFNGSNNSLVTLTAITHGRESFESIHAGSINLPSLGNITVDGTNAYREMVLTGAGGWGSQTNGVTQSTLEMSTNKQTFKVMNFADSEEVYAEWTGFLPSNYSGGELVATFYWTTTSGDSGNVIWQIKAVCYEVEGVLDAAWGTQVEIESSTEAAGLLLQNSAPPLTIGGVPRGGKLCQFKVTRDEYNDSFSYDAYLLCVVLRYPINAYSN